MLTLHNVQFPLMMMVHTCSLPSYAGTHTFLATVWSPQCKCQWSSFLCWSCICLLACCFGVGSLEWTSLKSFSHLAHLLHYVFFIWISFTLYSCCNLLELLTASFIFHSFIATNVSSNSLCCHIIDPLMSLQPAADDGATV